MFIQFDFCKKDSNKFAICNRIAKYCCRHSLVDKQKINLICTASSIFLVFFSCLDLQLLMALFYNFFSQDNWYFRMQETVEKYCHFTWFSFLLKWNH